VERVVLFSSFNFLSSCIDDDEDERDDDEAFDTFDFDIEFPAAEHIVPLAGHHHYNSIFSDHCVHSGTAISSGSSESDESSSSINAWLA